tara:strand:- start:314 stop:493 length:180 start_codon:yes stop_codon:yes gene_type:complete
VGQVLPRRITRATTDADGNCVVLVLPGRLDAILHVEPVRGRRVHVAIDELKDQRVVVGR